MFQEKITHVGSATHATVAEEQLLCEIPETKMHKICLHYWVCSSDCIQSPYTADFHYFVSSINSLIIVPILMYDLHISLLCMWRVSAHIPIPSYLRRIFICNSYYYAVTYNLMAGSVLTESCILPSSLMTQILVAPIAWTTMSVLSYTSIHFWTANILWAHIFYYK